MAMGEHGTGASGGRARAVALAAGALLALLAGCTPPPVQEMSDARQTIRAAEAAGAADCAAAEVATAAARRWLENASYALRIRDFPMARRSARRARRRAYDALVMLHVASPRPGSPPRLLTACPKRPIPAGNIPSFPRRPSPSSSGRRERF